MHDLISDVACPHEPVASDLSLDSEVPLLHIRRLGVVLESREHACSRIQSISIGCERKRIASGFEPERIIEAAARIGQLNLSAPWRTLRCGQIQFDGFHVIENAVAGAHPAPTQIQKGLSERIIHKREQSVSSSFFLRRLDGKENSDKKAQQTKNYFVAVVPFCG